MTPNVGFIDRLFRAVPVFGLITLVCASGLPFLATASVQIAVAALGVVILAVAAPRIGPIHVISGIKTCGG